MSNEIRWSRNAIEILIDEYQKHPCLWDAKSKYYLDRNARIDACKNICSVLTSIYPHIAFDVDKIKKKIHTMRSQHRVVKNKVDASMKPGSGFDSVHKPRLWFFDKFHFLNDRFPLDFDDSVRFLFLESSNLYEICYTYIYSFWNAICDV